MAEDVEGRKKALAKILPMQRQDFVELFQIMKGLPVMNPASSIPPSRVSAPQPG